MYRYWIQCGTVMDTANTFGGIKVAKAIKAQDRQSYFWTIKWNSLFFLMPHLALSPNTEVYQKHHNKFCLRIEEPNIM